MTKAKRTRALASRSLLRNCRRSQVSCIKSSAQSYPHEVSGRASAHEDASKTTGSKGKIFPITVIIGGFSPKKTPASIDFPENLNAA
jgi:hypothetical protein